MTLIESGSAWAGDRHTQGDHSPCSPHKLILYQVSSSAGCECYECQPKPAHKTFPGCTIRNMPYEPIHCICGPGTSSGIDSLHWTFILVQTIAFLPSSSSSSPLTLLALTLLLHITLFAAQCDIRPESSLSLLDTVHSTGTLPDQRVWTMQECATIFQQW